MKRRWLQSPSYRWLILLVSLLYVVSPFDLSPDFVPILGQIDDFVVLAFLMSQVFRLLLGQNTASAEGAHTLDDEDQAATTTINVTAIPLED